MNDQPAYDIRQVDLKIYFKNIVIYKGSSTGKKNSCDNRNSIYSSMGDRHICSGIIAIPRKIGHFHFYDDRMHILPDHVVAALMDDFIRNRKEEHRFHECSERS